MKDTIYNDLGTIEYKQAWDYQEGLFNRVMQSKLNKTVEPNYLLFCEHPHVFTLGKSGEEENFLIQQEFLKQINATYFQTNRGGDITYHGPGQLVGYPILDLEKFGVALKDYIYKLEEAIILTLAEYGIEGYHYQGATGVWLDTGVPHKTRKICAIGVKASRFVTMHGFALNVNTNLNYFTYINPCGFKDKGVTSMEKELGKPLDFEEVKAKAKLHLAKVFGMNLIG
ncbi:MAG TPA: lipoate--protein ligase [Marinilabiliales bacterium]|jgi:lipoyl(octanoyl) transferase|nr:MAG: lipoyl(octanoyl) transferase [Bacteroidetes bacterium GWA2_40_14]OFX65146.1 MAG: lipoyl(octanoyl) transferase [Bacteroidetes bacterium GWC2_40_13]OFX74322.1 MAG: lipoyl(octanoyl) transferase [Bacteroidetes bacterium GWD2_40_43]OFX90943.1 MAG: lipoyl(octanoyl) transferase [Bacteroidetes bacterium GWE2_40_63]OFY21157.1 MAG: lipoyl(octanoyl) transferase [Bacteroidetes bacterium GWF2_40_13]OFZ25365.1 MAG: lipoyl(octanoyl) transferase [Bacteroidetes bacterium RIFOXYC2_FULL_40_12]HAM98794.1